MTEYDGVHVCCDVIVRVLLGPENLKQHVLNVDEGGHMVGLGADDWVSVLTSIIHIVW